MEDEQVTEYGRRKHLRELAENLESFHESGRVNDYESFVYYAANQARFSNKKMGNYLLDA